MNLKKLYTKCGEHSGRLSLFRKFDSGYFLHDISHSENVASARRVLVQMLYGTTQRYRRIEGAKATKLSSCDKQ